MQSIFGETRTHVGTRHALIAPDGHVPSRLNGFDRATPYYLISPAMGADFVQMAIEFEPEGNAGFENSNHRQRFFYIESGEAEVTCGDRSETLESGGYLYAAKLQVNWQSKKGARITLFEAPFTSIDSAPMPDPVFGNAADIKGAPFLGNEHAILQTLLPDEIEWDMAVNIFTYQPGATLPFVETHIMEHGLLMLSGQGIYRLEDQYHPVAKDDVIWMAPYCPQWFVAMGDEPASYLYYKNINRHAISDD